MKISKWPISERPREKLLSLGRESLSDAELLSIFIHTGIVGKNALQVAQQLLVKYGSLRALLSCEKRTFCQNPGVGQAKYVLLQAVLELSQRYLAETLKRDSIFSSANQTRQYLQIQLRDEPNEVFAILLLDSQYRLLSFRKLFYGTINAASVYPRVIVKQALDANAAAIILAHNHPSGVAEPSQADKHITQTIKQAMCLIDVDVIDHFIIGDGVCVSFAERGLL